MMKKIIQLIGVLLSFAMLSACGMLNDGPYCDNSCYTHTKTGPVSNTSRLAKNSNTQNNNNHYANSNDNRFVIHRSLSSRSNDDYYKRLTQPKPQAVTVEGTAGLNG